MIDGFWGAGAPALLLIQCVTLEDLDALTVRLHRLGIHQAEGVALVFAGQHYGGGLGEGTGG